MEREITYAELHQLLDKFFETVKRESRYCLILFFTFLFPVSLFAESVEPKNNLVIWTKDGIEVVYDLLKKPQINFTETELLITGDGIEVNYKLENISRLTYEENTYSSIAKIKLDEIDFKLDDEYLIFHNLKAHQFVSLYSLNGELIFKKTINQDGEYAFKISNINKGVYILNVNGVTCKIIKS